MDAINAKQLKQTQDMFQPHWPLWRKQVMSMLEGQVSQEGFKEKVDGWFEPLALYYTALCQVNQHTNLTRIDDAEGFLWRHILDSLTLWPWVIQGASVLDLGSGAGVPALPLALTRPDVTVVAVDSVQKKCTFIHDVGQMLGLTNLLVCHGRSEDMAHEPKYREQFDVVTARAVAAIPTLLELGVPFIKQNGQLLALKQQSAIENEIPLSQGAMAELKVKLLGVETINSPVLNGHVIARFSRCGELDARYPRFKNKPRKSPL